MTPHNQELLAAGIAVIAAVILLVWAVKWRRDQ
jgi:hypothetical protein